MYFEMFARVDSSTGVDVDVDMVKTKNKQNNLHAQLHAQPIHFLHPTLKKRNSHRLKKEKVGKLKSWVEKEKIGKKGLDTHCFGSVGSSKK